MQNDKVIRCRCYPKTECMINSSLGNSCVTNEGCFKSININPRTVKRDLTMGCFKNKSQHYLMHCKVKEMTRFETKCCRDRDFCNELLTLPSDELLNMTDTIKNSQDDRYNNESGIQLMFAIILPICLLIIMAGLITVFWKNLWYHKRKSGLKLLHHRKNFHDSSIVKTPLFMCPINMSSSIHRNNIGWKIESHAETGLPGSKNSSEVGVKSNGTATTLLSGSNSVHGVTLDRLREDTCTSGSGSGLPFLVQRTVARQINLLECIGNGKFGEVWKGQFQGEMVAVKIFSSREEASWIRETTVYNTVLLRHDNILGYYASDIISSSGCTQLWMVMQYHPMGSLNEYLTNNSLNIYKALKLAHSAAAGLCHLHTNIIGLQGKPAIAHRDIKSKNILVKSNGTCCIADLGLAVFSCSIGPKIYINENCNRIVGTKRYMAPELLEIACSVTNCDSATNLIDINGNESKNFINVQDDSCMEGLKAVDVYAFSLVLWEIFSCINLDNPVEPYHLPFSEMVVQDPSFEDMYTIVVERNIRPIISDLLIKHLNPVIRIIEECWHQRPSIRLTMLRVKKSLFMLMKQISSLPTESMAADFLPYISVNSKIQPDFPFLLSTSSSNNSSDIDHLISIVK